MKIVHTLKKPSALPAFTAFVILLSLQAFCSREPSEKYLATTIHPAYAILNEIAGDRLTVVRLIKPGITPHNHDPLPSDIKKISNALGIYFVSSELDSWAAASENPNQFEIMKFLPESSVLKMEEDEDHHEGHSHKYDPHFWMDPMTVKSVIPGMAGSLCGMDPEGCEIYKTKAAAFENDLEKLHEEIQRRTASCRNKQFFSYHPSFRYFFKRYGLLEAGILEPVSGGEPTPRHISELIQYSRKNKVTGILMEAQFSQAGAEMLSRETSLPVFTVDASGGQEGRSTYRELLLYNAQILQRACR